MRKTVISGRENFSRSKNILFTMRIKILTAKKVSDMILGGFTGGPYVKHYTR